MGPPLPSAARPTAGFAQPAGCGGATHASRIPASPPHGEATVQNGILTGILFSLGAFIYHRMLPRIVPLEIQCDGSLHESARYAEPFQQRKIAALRFDATLFFANVSFFEDAILKLERENPQLEYILVVASGINHIDASAVEMLRRLVTRLRECGITLAFSSAKPQLMEVLERTGCVAEIGEENIFAADDIALK